MNQGKTVIVPDKSGCLDTPGLMKLENSFRKWAQSALRDEIRQSRRRILIIFLLIRYTGAKLNEVLALDLSTDIDFSGQSVVFGGVGESDAYQRKVELSAALTQEIREVFSAPDYKAVVGKRLAVDPGFVRRKFYERAQECGFPKELGGPEMIRKARAVEMMQNNVPLPVVQWILGQSTSNQASSYVSFSPEEISQITKKFMERESSRMTSARNFFFGKIQEIFQGDIQSLVRLITVGGHRVTTIITNTSLKRLEIKEGQLVAAEIKAPWVSLHSGVHDPASSADNQLRGKVSRISEGKVNTEIAVALSDGTEVCAVISTQSRRRLGIDIGDGMWALFNGCAVVLDVN